jgi:hypothetical protein
MTGAFNRPEAGSVHLLGSETEAGGSIAMVAELVDYVVGAKRLCVAAAVARHRPRRHHWPQSPPRPGRACARLEVGRSPRGKRRLRGKDDQLDAVRAARAALRREPLPRPRSGERREALRLLLVARRSAVDVRREALVQLRSVIVNAPSCGCESAPLVLYLEGCGERSPLLVRCSPCSQ